MVIFAGMIRSIRGCYQGEVIYTRQVRLKWKILSLATFVALAMVVDGCGGISASRTVSPLDFLLPGLMKASPPVMECTNLIATVR
jgi:hypothetical protein